MAAIINTNLGSLTAQRNLSMSQASLATSMQRLSSGLRINSAKDDAAGLAISDRFTTQIRGLNQAVRNANDGISLAQTGEGALAEVTNNLQRIRELGIQAANSTNSISDRAALDLEVQQRMAEIDRIASQTSFNGQKILNGAFGSAGFQVGANAGERIELNLTGDMRLTALGAIAKATSQALGSAATGGNIAVAANTLSFGTAAVAASVGSATISAATRSFGTAAASQVDGSSATITHTALDFANTYVAQVDATFTSAAAVTDFDYSGGAANLAQFDISLDGGTTKYGVTLSASYTDAAGVAAAIQAQVRAASGNAGFTVTAGTGADLNKMIYTNTGSLGAIVISNVDANATTAGFAAATGAAGTAASGTDLRASFNVDGTTVTLAATYADTAAVAAAITGQLTGYTATINEGTDAIVLTQTGSTAAVNITAGGAYTARANATGFAAATGTAGTAAVATTNASFTIDGRALTLNTNYASFDAMAADIESKMDTAAGSNAYSVTNNNGTLSVQRTGVAGVASTAVAITVADANATAAGLGVNAGTAGANATATTNANFTVDGNAVALTTNFADKAALVTSLQTQLGSGYTVAQDTGTGGFKITNNTTGSAAVTIAGADAGAVTANILDATGTAGATGGSVTLTTGQFTITAGSNPAVDMVGTYTNAKALAEAINSKVNNIYAAVDASGKLTLTSPEALVLGGSKATATGTSDFAFASANIAVDNGSISTANVRTIEGANDLVQRVDASLGTVSALRSTFGAIQGRFDTVIASLSTTAENLTASRSRIQDADFAQETANLSRAQILQQAGTAMVAQANQMPQGVLALLK